MLRVGMTARQVTALLGKPASRHRGGPVLSREERAAMQQIPLIGDFFRGPERWEAWFYGEYDLIAPDLPAGAKSSFRVDFDRDGRVSFWHPYCFLQITDTLHTGSDSLESFFGWKEGTINASLKPPTLLRPPDRSVFHHFPRHLTLEWLPDPETPHDAEYILQSEFTTGDNEDFGDWSRSVGPPATKRTAKRSFKTTHVGNQPGRWRVKVRHTNGESAWSPWWYYRFD